MGQKSCERPRTTDGTFYNDLSEVASGVFLVVCFVDFSSSLHIYGESFVLVRKTVFFCVEMLYEKGNQIDMFLPMRNLSFYSWVR